MTTNRRRFLQVSAAAAGAAALAGTAQANQQPTSVLQLNNLIKEPVPIASIELLRNGNHFFVRSRSKSGAEGIAYCNDRVRYLYPILLQKVVPYFLNKDARNLEEWIDGVYVHQSNYKLAGLALWCCAGWVEFSLLDMLGKIAKRPVGELFGKVTRKQIPVYLSSMRRDTTPKQEVSWIGPRIQQTGARAVKLKIGGRMSNNADASPGRTNQLISLARKTFGDQMTIYVDANGSYDAQHAIEVGKMLQANNVAFFEEPCPFDEYEQTKQVADKLTMAVAGGEQDTSWARFRWMIEQRGVDIVQPDLNYNGGFIRAVRVARLAAKHNLPTTPHAPQPGPNLAYMLHFATFTPNIGPYQEYNGAPRPPEKWYAPNFEVRNGAVDVPTGPGLGITYDADFLKKATIVTSPV